MDAAQPYVLSLAAGLLVGAIYGLLGVRSPAPPIIALLGLAGILVGEQIGPVLKTLIAGRDLGRVIREDCAPQVLRGSSTRTRLEDGSCPDAPPREADHDRF